MDDIAKIIGFVFAFCIMLVFFCLLAAIPTYYLWNYLVPSITKGALTGITFWQAFWLNFLTSILFKNTAPSSSK